MELRIFKPGSEVTAGKESARVLSVQLDGPLLQVRYEIGFWKAGEWKTTWLPSSEVDEVRHSTGLLITHCP